MFVLVPFSHYHQSGSVETKIELNVLFEGVNRLDECCQAYLCLFCFFGLT